MHTLQNVSHRMTNGDSVYHSILVVADSSNTFGTEERHYRIPFKTN
jgi:hypothetical protein